jgi:hypothetical protein
MYILFVSIANSVYGHYDLSTSATMLGTSMLKGKNIINIMSVMLQRHLYIDVNYNHGFISIFVIIHYILMSQEDVLSSYSWTIVL